MEQVKNYYKRFVNEGFDENGVLNKFELACPDNFNFGYDIIDKYGITRKTGILILLQMILMLAALIISLFGIF